MTADRSRAYGHVLEVLAALGPAKLHDVEQAVVREAADALVLTRDVATDEDARAALDALDDLLDRLVDADRLEGETAEALVLAVEACGPSAVPLLV
jgi:hypothetical protein